MSDVTTPSTYTCDSPSDSVSASWSTIISPTSYTIKAGDTFASIAGKLGISVLALQSENPGVVPTALQVGQVINLPGQASIALTSTLTSTRTITVSSIIASVTSSSSEFEPLTLELILIIVDIIASLSSSYPAASSSSNSNATPVDRSETHTTLHSVTVSGNILTIVPTVVTKGSITLTAGGAAGTAADGTLYTLLSDSMIETIIRSTVTVTDCLRTLQLADEKGSVTGTILGGSSIRSWISQFPNNPITSISICP